MLWNRTIKRKDTMTSKGIYNYSEYLTDLAQELAEVRSKLSEKVYNSQTDMFRGSEESRISSLGVLGELIAREHFKQVMKPSTNYKFTPIVEITPLPEPDFYYKDLKFDIKTIDTEVEICMVNEKAYRNPDKKVDWYWFVNLKGNYTCEHIFVKHEDVQEWDLKQFKYTNAYWRKTC